MEKSLQIESGKSYLLRNGLKTGPLRMANNGTNYIYEADVVENDKKYVFAFLKTGKFLTDTVDDEYDIVEIIN